MVAVAEGVCMVTLGVSPHGDLCSGSVMEWLTAIRQTNETLYDIVKTDLSFVRGAGSAIRPQPGGEVLTLVVAQTSGT